MEKYNLKNTETEVRTLLDSFVLCRFKSMKQLKNQLVKIFYPKYKINIVEESEKNNIGDYCFVGTIINKNISFDFDMWYLKDRQKNLLITETAGETQ